MREGVYRIADTVFRICSIYDQVHRMCREYCSDELPELTVEISESDIAQERVFSEEQNRREHIPVLNHSDAYLETLAVHRKIAGLLLDRGILLFHGSAIAVDGEVYLFSAPSGTGKSTHTRLWRERFGERAYMVNDDKPLLKVTDSGVLVYGTPWNGKHHLSRNVCVPLKALCFLERGEENRIAQITTAQALPMLLPQTHCPRGRREVIQVLDLLNGLVGQVKLYRLKCNMMPEAAEVSYQGMR